MFLLGITGRKRAGKNTAGKIVEECLTPHKIVSIAFADSLKEEVGLATNRTIQFIDEHKDNFRLILQGWGTDFRRNLCDTNYWVHRWLDKVYHTNGVYGIIATDVRFLNEAKAIHELGGLIWRITRPSDCLLDKHPSEVEMDNIKVDETFSNDGSLGELRSKIVDSIKKWKVT